MAKQVVSPRVRGFVCITAHPEGCAAHVREQIAYVKSRPSIKNGPKNVLVIGSSTGYGLASRISAAFGAGANTFGVYFERPSANGKTASAGWYNTAAFEAEARKAGLYAASMNGDAFSSEMKTQVIERLKKEMPKIDLVVYSLAAPRRTDPVTGEVYKSVLKTVGEPFVSKNLDTDKKLVNEATIEPANEEEIKATVKVMGGEDWKLWIEALDAAGLLADGCQSVAYSYVGPALTWPIYKDGSIGQAKKDLYAKAKEIDAILKIKRGRAFVSVNKAVVTQASSAIPVVPLYISILFKVMKAKGLHEDCIEQIQRLFETQMYNDGCLNYDDAGLVHIDDWEMRDDVQKKVFEIWPKITTENLETLSDFAGYQSGFLKLFGFGLDGVDYAAEVETEVPIA